MPFTPVDDAKCPICNNLVRAAEEMLACGQKYHKGCFKCSLCNKQMDGTNTAEHAGQLFCKQCYARKFGPKGYGFSGGAGSLSMDVGEHLGSSDTATTDKP